MSDSDLEELPHTGWFDSEPDLPEISSVDSTLGSTDEISSVEPGVIVSSPSATTQMYRAVEVGDSSAMGPAPNKGNPVGHVPLQETESCKGESFLDTPIHTPPQSKSQPPFPCHSG